MLGRLSNLVSTRPWRVLAACAALVLGGVLIGIPGLGSLSGTGFDVPGSDSVEAAKQIERAAGTQATPAIIAVLRPSEPLATKSAADEIARIRAIIATAGGDGVASVFGPSGRVGDPFVSSDGTSGYLAVTVRDDDAAERVTRALADVPGLTVGGRWIANEQINAAIRDDLTRAELIAFPILFLLSLWVFRGIVAALLPPLVGAIVILSAFLALSLLNHVMEISIYAVNLVTGLSLGLAIDYSLLMISRYREELAKVGPGPVAMGRTLSTAGRSVLFSAITVAGALGALAVFAQRFLVSMGIGGAIVSLLAGAAALTVLPALLGLLGHRVNALAVRPRRPPNVDADGTSRGGWYRLSNWVMRRPGRIALATSVALIAVGLPTLGIRFTTVDASVLPKTESARIVSETLRREFRLDTSAPIVIAIAAARDQSTAVNAFAERLGGLDGVQAVTPPTALAQATWRLTVLPKGPALSTESQTLIREIRAIPHPAPVLVGGLTANFIDQRSSLGRRLPIAILLVASVTVVALFLMTGSLVLPIKAVLMNILTLSATLGTLVMVFQWGHLEGLLRYTSQGGLDVTQPILIAALAFGLSTDYAVFLLSRIKEAHDSGLGEREAVAAGLERTGRIVTAAALLFCVAVGSFATSRIVVLKELGLGTALAVLLDATIIRALLVPALMALLGHRNWWAPAPLRRLHNRIGVRKTFGD